WINVHPSALLAPVIALLFGRWLVAGISAAALLVNPYGWHAVRAPFELTSLASSGEFVNAEWLPSDPKLFPLLYATAAVVALALLIAPQKRANLWRFGVLAMLLILAIQHVRNQGLYFAALPLLVPPMRFKHVAFAVAALVPVGWAFAHDVHHI